MKAIELIEKIYVIGAVRIELRDEYNMKIAEFSITELKRYLDLLDYEVDSFFARTNNNFEYHGYVIFLKNFEVIE